MCGRFASKLEAEMERQWMLNRPPPEFSSYNVAPGTDIPVVRQIDGGERELVFMRWGLIPYWAKEARIGYKMINARGETIREKSSYRQSFERRRCLIPADGFYEWQRTPAGRLPHYIHLRDESKLPFAGIWDRWKNPQGETVQSCSIVTSSANELLQPIHERMPVIIPPAALGQWLAGTPNEAYSLLGPYPAEHMAVYPVSTYVNKPEHDDERCVEPLATLI